MTSTCVITGAAAGIGRALAERFARGGHRILGIDVDARACDRAQRELSAAGHSARYLPLDLCAPESAHRVLEEVQADGPVEVFVHNAGINCVGAFADSVWGDQRRVLELNLTVPLALTAGLLGRGLLAPTGTLVFVSSLSRFVSYPGAAAYAASKDGLASYARSLRTSLAPRGQNVLTVFPGPTRTEHARRHSPDNSKEHRRMPPEVLAEGIWTAVEARRAVLVPGLGNRLAASFGQVAPSMAEKAMRKALFERLS